MIDITQIKPNPSNVQSLVGSEVGSKESNWITIGEGLLLSNGVLSAPAATNKPLTPAAEVLQGAVDGTNTVFTLSNTPAVNSQVIYYNGIAQWISSGDYSLLGNTITFTVPPTKGSSLVAQYWH